MPPVYKDFSFPRDSDASLFFGTLSGGSLSGQSLSGQSLLFTAKLAFGGVSGVMVKSCASGFNGVSGLTVTGSGVVANVWAGDTSGIDYRNLAYELQRTESGFRTSYSLGWLVITPSTGV